MAQAAPTLPDAGAQSSILSLAGLALMCVLVGLGLHQGVRRRPNV